MKWFSERLRSAGVGGVPVQMAEFLDSKAAEAGSATLSVFSAIERNALTAALAPSVTGIHLSQLNLQAVEKTAAQLVKSAVDTVFAASRVAATPYAIAAEAIATPGADVTKVGRGAIAGGLAAVKLGPFLFNRLSRLGGQTPEKIARALTTAPLEVALASSLQAAHDVLEPAARPVPRAVRKLLQDHFDADLLDRARYLVSSFGLTVPEAVNCIRVAMSNNTPAFTVLNVIVFTAHPGGSEPSIGRWAYGLAHAEQFEQLGLDGWTEKYFHNLAELEAEAQRRAEQVESAVKVG